MCDNVIKIVEDFQTLIVGVIGFSGVIVTMAMNARLSRKQHERRVSHEQEAMRTALCAELEFIQKSFKEKCTLDQKENEIQSAFFLKETPNLVYQNFIAKIGLLSANEVSAVIEAYALVGELPKRLGLLSNGHDPSFNRPGYIFIRAEHVDTATGIYKKFLPSIEHALSTLRDYLNAR